MKFKLFFVDEGTMTYDENGILVGVTNAEGKVEDPSLYAIGSGQSDISGIWDGNNECTIPWDEVVKYEYTDFHLTPNMYLDNGQVVDEGLIVAIEVDGTMKWDIRSTGGCDTSGWMGTDDNVYCESCDTHYKVEVNLDGYKPHWCSFCGSKSLILRVDVLH